MFGGRWEGRGLCLFSSRGTHSPAGEQGLLWSLTARQRMLLSTVIVPNSMWIRRFLHSLRSSLKTFSKGWSRENITFHMARAALQTQSALSAGLPWPLCRVLQPWVCLPPWIGVPGGPACAGRRGLWWCSLWGRGEHGGRAVGWLGQLWLLRAWSTQRSWRAWWDGGPCSSGMSCSFPWVWQPESLGPSPHVEEVLRAVGASTCQLV